MNRRSWIRSLALSGIAPALLPGVAAAFAPSRALALTTRPGLDPARTVGAAAPSPLQAFSGSFEGIGETLGPASVPLTHRLPAGLAGTLFRNGPARMRRGATAFDHWFDGDGMIQSLRLSATHLHHSGRMVATTRSVAEARAGRYLWGGFGTTLADGLPVRRPDDVNVGNISVLALPDELLALWEAGSAWRIDPATLATRGRKVFSEATDGLAFSAHPRVDPDGRIWNFGYAAGSGRLVIYDIARDGSLARAVPIEAPNADMVHDFAVTATHLVFLLTPVLLREREARGAGSFASQLQWHPDRPAFLMLVDKSTLARTHLVELPNLFAFHLGNAWQDGRTLRLEVVRSAPFDGLMQSIGAATRGESFTPPARMRPVDIALDVDRHRATLSDLPIVDVDFPRFDPRHVGRRTSRLVLATRAADAQPGVFGFNAIGLVDRVRERVTTFSYGPRFIAEEHVFVARPGSREGDGWIVGTAYDWTARRTSLSVFDANALDAGPVTSARLPYGLPLGLHGQFVAARA